jgi:hypothetical protein
MLLYWTHETCGRFVGSGIGCRESGIGDRGSGKAENRDSRFESDGWEGEGGVEGRLVAGDAQWVAPGTGLPREGPFPMPDSRHPIPGRSP